ncbi:Crp/Fnr family transcriptional regulator [Desulfovibrio sp. SGI.169]|uniref:Crp/Fnr family transcriptional regulator n=1 Tax=Desulfovibrio sp. SGI.169 TaxID=3420561 RepID=UPI003D03515C
MREFPGGRASQAVLEALGSGLFAVLGADERLSLAARARLRVFARGETLFREGQESADPAFLLSGLVKLSRSAARGRECALHLVRPGRMLDAGVLFYEGGLPATAVGVREGRLLWLEKAALLDALRGNTALCLGLIAALSLRQRLFINKLAGSQGRISASRRVAAWLLHRAKMEKSETLDLLVSREVLARLIGISRESLSREMSLLAASGLISVERRRVILLDRTRLQKLADS